MGEIADKIEELKLSALDCRGCGLCETRSNVVFGEGNPETPLVIIGEGPGQNEDATGRPFVGRAGALLDQALLENNLTRKHVYIANVIKCRACITENGRTRNRPPSTSEINLCLPWLEKQLAIIQPLVILCLGAPSAKSIIHKDFKMTQERGKFFESKYVRYAIAALHPAYILRQDGETYELTRRQLVEDIAAARQKVIEAKKEPIQTLF
ncbi:MAG: uracil-DNA glycosylase [Armatimonadota bacterium]|nr:uracil-DNA glycosylase [Armatimonadota bacterium]